MPLIDLSRTIEHRTPTHPSHPPVSIGVWNDHSEVKVAGAVRFTSMSLHLTLGDHAGTHVDAPRHFNSDPAAPGIDAVPLENYYTEALCLDLSHVALKSQISAAELSEAERKSGAAIKPGDTVLLHMNFHARTWGTPAYLHDFPGLSEEAAHWLADKGIVAFGVEAISPGTEGANNFRVHQICRDRGITHYECLVNLDQLVGKGRFRFIAFPLKIKGGTGSPVRAVAVLP